MTETTTALASSAPTRYDDLVQPDRVHRLVYTDARIFSAELRDLFGRVWVYVGHESEIPQAERLPHPHRRRSPRDRHPRPPRPGERPAQPLPPSRRHRLPPGPGARQALHLPVPRLGLRQRRRADRRTVAERVPLRVRPRRAGDAPAARRVPPRVRLRHAGPRRRAARRLPRGGGRCPGRVDRPLPGRPPDCPPRGAPDAVQGQLEARARQLRRRLPPLLLAPVAAADGGASRRRQGHDLLRREPRRRPALLPVPRQRASLLDQRPAYGGPGSFWERQRPAPGREHVEERIRARHGDDATACSTSPSGLR